jgi:flagellar hook-associated protein 1 FlgK
MASLFSALSISANSLQVLQNSLAVSENNIANASTPGYVEQTQTVEAMPLDLGQGSVGGVVSGPVVSARNIYSEQAVQSAQTALGTWNQQVSTLQPLQSSFDLTGASGIPGALNQLFQSFSTWSANPTDGTAQQGVLNAAQSVAQAFQQESTTVSEAVTGVDSQLGGLVSQVNTLTAQLALDNGTRTGGSNGDPSVDANAYSTLEQLSQLVPITTLNAPDGSMTVLLAGQTPLVIGQTQYAISSGVAVPANPPPANPSGPPSPQVLDSNGNDITSEITQGQVGGLLQANAVLAQLQGDSSQQGSLNQLAQGLADTVNNLLTSGNISDANPATGAPAVSGIPLFSYAPGNPTSVASTLSVNPAITSSQLAAIEPGPPEVDNGIALQLAGLASPQTPTGEINNMSFTQYYGNIAANVGSAISTATTNQATDQQIVTQAQNLRQQSSGVDLNTEAIKILQFQQSYGAAAKMVSILDSLTETVVNMIS